MAKFCANCGTPLEEGSVFCDNCGARIDPSRDRAAKRPQAPVWPQPQQPARPAQPAPPEKKHEKASEKNTGLIVGLIVSAVVAVAAIVLLVLLLLQNKSGNDPQPTSTTAAVTEQATERPTLPPTDAPTEALTEASTEAPTEAPTEAQTEAPTEPPTEAPSREPLPYEDDLAAPKYTDFVWIADADSGNLTGTMLGSDEFLGRWKGEYKYDAGNAWELVYVTIDRDGTITIEPYQIYAADWVDNSSAAVRTFRGEFNASSIAGSGDAGEINLHTFLAYNGIQYGVGTIDVNGSSGLLYLTRP